MDAPLAFRSKVDWWLILLLAGIPVIPLAIEWNDGGRSSPAFFLIPAGIVALISIVFFPIHYVIEGETISVRYGIMRWEYTAFRVQEVQSVRPTFNPLASPALSIDRLSVDLGFRGKLLISPKDKAGFLRALAQLDPQLRPQDGSLLRSPKSPSDSLV
jgi:hypothetical protein